MLRVGLLWLLVFISVDSNFLTEGGLFKIPVIINFRPSCGLRNRPAAGRVGEVRGGLKGSKAGAQELKPK